MAKKVLNQSDLRQMMQKLKEEKGGATSTNSRTKKYKLSSKELALIENEKKRKADQDLNEKKKFAKKAGVPENFFDSAKTKAFLNLQKEPQKSILKKGASPAPERPKPPPSSAKASGSEWTSSEPVLNKNVTPKEKSSKQKSPKIKKTSPRPGLLRTPSGGAIGHDSEEDDTAEKEEEVDSGAVPEGFFDDPVQDAKVRGLEYKDPEEEEWANWTKEIATELTQSADMNAENQLGETVDRQIEEIDEQMRAWTRVIQIEKKKEVVDEQVKSKKDNAGKEETIEDSDEELDDEALDDLFDWRKKKT